MAQRTRRGRSRRRLSLSVRLILLVLFAALVPLAVVVGINDYFARGTLLQQGDSALKTDANAKSTLIETYMGERLADGSTLAQVPTSPYFVACNLLNPPPAALQCDTQFAFYKGSVGRALQAGIDRGYDPVTRDKNLDYYTEWDIFDARGKLLLSSNPKIDASKVEVPPEDLQPVVKEGKQWISAVHYDPQDDYAFVRLYTPIVLQTSATQSSVVGFLQATLRLDYIWSIVNGEQGANGNGSYAFITDENGIRIADTHAENLFTAVQPLDATTEQLITSEQRFGTNTPVSQVDLPQVGRSLQDQSALTTFQGVAVPGSSVQYQFVRIRMSVKDVSWSWSYFVLSPMSTVTQVADDQVEFSLVSAGVIALLAILIGLFFGRRTTVPVRSSVAELQGAAVVLKELAVRQESSAGEQHWVVDACRTGLESVRYLANAMDQAAHRIVDASNWFNDYGERLTPEQSQRTVQHLRELASYIDEAARRQQASSDRLDKAIDVTMQVSDQLVSGAAAAGRSADQLEQVVSDLQHVVGGHIPAVPTPADFDLDQPIDGRAPAPNAPMMPAPQSQRQMMPAPRAPGQGQPMLPEPRQPAHSRVARGGPPSQWAPNGPPSSRGGYGGYN
ncbi:MAG TPA: hypothetical protein VGP82_23960, partial [Ktedonobacterales bacterium]|nr:hypothetical protein [Ktedonobacterales bacterium]